MSAAPDRKEGFMSDIFEQPSSLSFEVFPPKKDGEFEAAFSLLDELGELKPDFISVTYGAGGSHSKKTADIASYIQNRLHIPALAHLTCVGSKKEDIRREAESLREQGVTHILALRGDRPKDMSDEQFASRDFAHASHMIRYLKSLPGAGLQIAGACYPEKHYEAESLEQDLARLKEKQEAGARYLINQLFFDNRVFYRFLDRAAAKGITLPVSAGIMPITTARQIGTTVSLSGSSVPKELTDLIARYCDSPQDMRKAGIDYAVRQILDLKSQGVSHIHIYTMNRPKTAAEITAAVRS